MKKITELDEQELTARIAEDEDRLRKWHRPRLAHLEQTRLIRILDPDASILQGDPLLKGLTALIISTRPREFWNWAVGTLASQPFRYSNPYSTEARRWGQSEKGSAIVEYLAYGIEAQENDISGKRGDEDASRFELARQVLSGSYAFYPRPVDVGGDIVFRRDYFDPAQVFWLPGRLGMQIVLRSYLAPLLDVRQEIAERKGNEGYLTGKETELVQCIEAYYLEGGKVYSALVTVGGMKDQGEKKSKTLALPLKPLDGYEYIPLICGSVNILDTAPSRVGAQGAAPVTPGENVWERWGQSVLASVIQAVQGANTWKTLAHYSARQALKPTKVRETEGGEAPEEKPVGLGEQENIVLRAGSNEDYRYVAKPSPALDVSRESDEFNRELDIATISPSLMGQTEPQVVSGVLREGWESATRTAKLGVYDEAMKAIEKRAKMQSIRKFKQMSGKTHLWGKHPLERKGLDGYFEGDFTPAQVPTGFWAIEVYRAPARPIDRAAIGNEVRARLLSGTMSMRRALEELGEEDPEGELEKIAQERIENLPLMVAMKTVDTQARMLRAMRDRIAELRADPKKAKPDEDVENLERQADLLESVYRQTDLELGMMGRQMTQALQGPAGREALQPNASLMAPAPPPGVEPPEMRGEGKMQKQAALMAGGPVTGGA